MKMRLLFTLLLVLPATAFALDPASTATAEVSAASISTAKMDAISHRDFLAVPDGGVANGLLRPLPGLHTHRFFDRENVVGIVVHAAIRSADAAQTCTFMGHNAKEAWLPMKSCSGVAAYSLSMIPAQIATSYFLHRRGAHRLERLTPYLWAAPSAAGIAISARAW
jgi:hypothetical protein